MYKEGREIKLKEGHTHAPLDDVLVVVEVERSPDGNVLRVRAREKPGHELFWFLVDDLELLPEVAFELTDDDKAFIKSCNVCV